MATKPKEKSPFRRMFNKTANAVGGSALNAADIAIRNVAKPFMAPSSSANLQKTTRRILDGVQMAHTEDEYEQDKVVKSNMAKVKPIPVPAAGAPSVVGPPAPPMAADVRPNKSAEARDNYRQKRAEKNPSSNPKVQAGRENKKDFDSPKGRYDTLEEKGKALAGAANTAAAMQSAPDGSKIMPTNLRTQKDAAGKVTSFDLAPLVKDQASGREVRINRATGMPFGYSPGDALPSGADAAMQQRGADSKARQTSVNNAEIARRKTESPMAAQLRPTAEGRDAAFVARRAAEDNPYKPRNAVKPAAPVASVKEQNIAKTGRSDGYQARGVHDFAREQAEHQEMKNKGLSGDSWNKQGRPDMAKAFPNAMSNREAFGHEIPKGETPAQAKVAEAKSVASVTRQAPQPVAAVPYDTLMKKRRGGGRFS